MRNFSGGRGLVARSVGANQWMATFLACPTRRTLITSHFTSPAGDTSFYFSLLALETKNAVNFPFIAGGMIS